MSLSVPLGEQQPAAPPLILCARLLHDQSLRVVNQLSHGYRWNGNGNHVLARRRRNVGCACEPRPNIRDFFVEHHDHLEVRGLLIRSRLTGGLDGAVADFRDVPLNVRFGMASMVIFAIWPERDFGMFSIVDFHSA